jgi:hypothetical protein
MFEDIKMVFRRHTDSGQKFSYMYASDFPFSKYNFQILANDHLKKKVNWKQLYLFLLVIRPN